jgi:hypothetical protein
VNQVAVAGAGISAAAAVHKYGPARTAAVVLIRQRALVAPSGDEPGSRSLVFTQCRMPGKFPFKE